MMTPTTWRVSDLRVGMIVYNPPMERVDPVTRLGTGELMKFRVTKIRDGQATLRPYRGPRPAVLPPDVGNQG